MYKCIHLHIDFCCCCCCSFYYIFRIVLKQYLIIFILQFLPLLLKTTTSFVVIPDQNIFFHVFVYVPCLCLCQVSRATANILWWFRQLVWACRWLANHPVADGMGLFLTTDCFTVYKNIHSYSWFCQVTQGRPGIMEIFSVSTSVGSTECPTSKN